MKIYTVERLDILAVDNSHQGLKLGAYINRQNAIACARDAYEKMAEEYKDDIEKYAHKVYSNGGLYHEVDDENGYYEIQFGFYDNYEFHCVSVEEWELEE